MLNTVYLISENYDDFKVLKTNDITNSFELSILIDCYSPEKLNETYLFFSENHTCKFSITIESKHLLPKFCIQSIAAFFFIPAYGCTQKTVNIICEESAIFNEISTNLKKAALSQGIDNLSVNLLSVPGSTISNSIVTNTYSYKLFKSTSELLLAYQDMIMAFEIGKKLFCYPAIQFNTAQLLIDLQHLEGKFKKNYPALYDTLEGVSYLSESNIKIKRNNLNLLNELENFKDHNKILRLSNSATELQAYYDREYEILPLWFKKAGHLLKVLMGKRTFRSLFNDNVKKYKV